MDKIKIRKEAFIDVIQGSITDYVILKKLGDGSFGSVFLAQHTQTKLQRAIKQIPKSRIKRQDRLQNEVNIMRAADHPNIVKLLDVINGPRLSNEQSVILIFEYIDFDLNNYMRNFTGNLSLCKIKDLMKQMLNGVDFLHVNRIIHVSK